MSDLTSVRKERPSLSQFQNFQPTPKYIFHKAAEDKIAILVCQIKIWQASGNDWFSIPGVKSCLTIRECESIEISDSSKELINKAVVKFPRGTVISKSSNRGKNVKSGIESGIVERHKDLENTNNNGDVTSTMTAKFVDDGVSTTSMAANYDDKGLVNFNRSKTEIALLSPNDVAIGNRIEIRLGYAYSENEYKEMNDSDGMNMDMVFTGFITSISVDTPLELECTNMAHILTTISVPDIQAKDTLKIKDFLDEGGKYDLLKDTGISLHEASKNCQITVSGGSISHNLSVADVLTEWNKSGVLCMMENSQSGVSTLRVGLTYYAGKGGGSLPNNDKKYITYNGGNTSVLIIQFDWDVVEDKLNLMRNDKKYLAIEASAMLNKQPFKFTLIKNPDRDDEGWIIDSGGANNYDGQFRKVNSRKPKPKKKQKHTDGTYSDKKINGHLSDKIDLSKYNVIHYTSINTNITEEQLIEEAKQYWAQYVPNGISGSVTLFGDVFVKPTDIVGLVDVRQPEKDGYYFVESVNTTFGLGGYRRELKLPFKIASFDQQIKYLE